MRGIFVSCGLQWISFVSMYRWWYWLETLLNLLTCVYIYIYILHTVVYCMWSGTVNTNQHDKSGDTLVTSTLIHPMSVLTVALAIRTLSEEKLNLCMKIILKFVCLFFTVKYFLQIQTLVWRWSRSISSSRDDFALGLIRLLCYLIRKVEPPTATTSSRTVGPDYRWSYWYL